MVKPISPTKSYTYNSTTFNVYHANKGEGLPKHDHTFSHLSSCQAGSCLIRKEGKECVLTKNSDPINLVENEWHEIEALQDDTIFVNIFSSET